MTQHTEQGLADDLFSPTQYANPGRPLPPPPVRTGTMVWGILAVVLGLATIAVALGQRLDIEIALIGIFVIAGLGLLLGSAVAATQRARRRR